MRRWAGPLTVLCLLATGCAGDSASDTTASTATTAPPEATTTTTVAPATSTTSTTTPPAATTSTSLVVPPAECAVDLPVSDLDEVTDVELAGFSVGAADSVRVWSVGLGDRPVEMDTLGDRAFIATFDGLVASFDVDPCGLDWFSTVPAPVTGVIATGQGVFVVSQAALSIVDLIEGAVTSVDLEEGSHVAVAGPDVLAVSDGTSVLLYDYLTEQASPLDVGNPVVGLASADAGGLALAHGITVEMRTWLGAPIWARDLPDPVASITIADGLMVAELTSGPVVVLEVASGDVIWEKSFAAGSTISVGPIDHDELHILEIELGVAARHHHLNPGDGSTVFVQESPALQTFAEYDDNLILDVDQGQVTGRGMLEQELWTIATGADGLGRFTEVDVASGLVIALSYSAERF